MSDLALIVIPLLVAMDWLVVWFFAETVIKHINRLDLQIQELKMMINDIQNCVDDLMERTADIDE